MTMLYARSLLLLIFLTGSLGAEDDPTKKKEVWFPTEKDTEWTYRSSGATLIQKVVGFEPIAGKRCAKLEIRVSDRVVGTEHVAVESDGIYRCAIGGQKIEPPLLFLRLPPKDGDSWEISSTIQNQTIKGKLIVSASPIKIDNTFYKQAFLVRTEKPIDLEGKKVDMQMWFAPGVGMIKQTISIGNTKATLELVPKKK